MTNSTDKAAASAAIRVAPRRGRVKAGVVLDRDGVTVVQSREGIDAIESYGTCVARYFGCCGYSEVL